jgi:hypothetical protein
MSSAARASDWRGRADAVRDLPLEAILHQRGAVRSPHDKSKWHTERGSLSLTGSKFHNWCQQVGGGGAIDLVMHLADVDFRQAVVWLEQQFGVCHTRPLEAPPRTDNSSSAQRRHSPSPVTFIHHQPSTLTQQHSTPTASRYVPTNRLRQLTLPVADPRQLDRVHRYLTQRRCLPESLLEPLIASGKIYADHRGNAVFLLVAGKAQRPIGAELRGTGPQIWRGLAPGTDKNAGFFWTGDTSSRTIVLCESAIDAISCSALIPECLAISTSGARPDPRWLSGQLVRDYIIHCGFDTDAAGDRAACMMMALHPTIKRLTPSAHDWNDALQAAHRSSST